MCKAKIIQHRVAEPIKRLKKSAFTLRIGYSIALHIFEICNEVIVCSWRTKRWVIGRPSEYCGSEDCRHIECRLNLIMFDKSPDVVVVARICLIHLTRNRCAPRGLEIRSEFQLHTCSHLCPAWGATLEQICEPRSGLFRGFLGERRHAWADRRCGNARWPNCLLCTLSDRDFRFACARRVLSLAVCCRQPSIFSLLVKRPAHRQPGVIAFQYVIVLSTQDIPSSRPPLRVPLFCRRVGC